MTSRIGIAMVVLATVSLVASSGGVSSVAVERSVEVAIADDESEQLVSFSGTQNGSAVTVTNRAAESLTVEKATVAGSRADSRAANATTRLPDSIEPGETGSIDVTGTSCDGETSVPIEIRVATESTTVETTVNACEE